MNYINLQGTLEGFFNEDESVLFLHIEGLAYDAASCLEACQELRSAISESVMNSNSRLAFSLFLSILCYVIIVFPILINFRVFYRHGQLLILTIASGYYCFFHCLML